MTDPTSHPWMNDHRIGKTQAQHRDTRQHSPCRSCYSDCISEDTTALLQFRCPNCGKEHTTTRGDSIRYGTFIARYNTHLERNV